MSTYYTSLLNRLFPSSLRLSSHFFSIFIQQRLTEKPTFIMKISAVILLLLLFSCQSQTTDSVNPKLKDDRPNIILLVADDHGKDAIGAYGNPVIKTPHLDALAATGTRFDRAFCTTASCSASRSVILSGQHNHANGHFGHQHSYHHFSSYDTIQSMPVVLAKAGYRTARIGKYHVAPESVYHFQEVFKANSRSAVEMAEKTKDFVQADDPNPFFLYFCFSDPHRGGGFAKELPHQPDRFGNQKKGYPGVTPVIYDPAEVLVPAFLTDTPETRAEIAQYYQSISRLDAGVGQLIAYLKESGQFDNTLIVYISDNGMAFPGAKTTLYEAGMQLPCIVKAPGQKAANINNEMVSWPDLLPTFLDYAGVEDSEITTHGVSIRPALTDNSLSRQAVYASHTFHEVTMYYPMRVIRGEKYKLIMNLADGLDYPFASDLFASKTWQSVLNKGLDKLGEKPIAEFLHRPRFELYDISTDPFETINLASQATHLEILTGMQQQLRQFQIDTKDPWLYKWEYE